MAQKPSQSGLSSPTKAVEAQTEAVAAMQKDLLAACEEMSHAWMERMKSEAEFWSEFGAKLSSTRSVPDAMSAYQEGIAQRMKTAADDGRRLFEDGQKMFNIITRGMATRWPSA